MTAADCLIDTIHDWGVDVVFGLPGDGINGIMEALRRRQDDIRFIQVRHEEAAAFMACAYAKFTGKLGVCVATSGPGGIHLLNGLYDAKLDCVPVLAITANPDHKLRALEAGAKDFISKPFDPPELVRRVYNMLEVRLLHQETRKHGKMLESLALQDPLTGLANRRLLVERLEQALRRSALDDLRRIWSDRREGRKTLAR